MFIRQVTPESEAHIAPINKFLDGKSQEYLCGITQFARIHMLQDIAMALFLMLLQFLLIAWGGAGPLALKDRREVPDLQHLPILMMGIFSPWPMSRYKLYKAHKTFHPIFISCCISPNSFVFSLFLYLSLKKISTVPKTDFQSDRRFQYSEVTRIICWTSLPGPTVGI